MTAINRGKQFRALVNGWPIGLLPLLLAGFCNPAQALGVGEPQLLSAYAQPLRVRVPISLDGADERGGAEALHADLVPEDEYSHYGVADQDIELNAIYAASRSDGTHTWIEIGSTQPMREPATILLLRVRLGSTLIVKEVPLLFDLDLAQPPAEAAAALDNAAAIAASSEPLPPPAADAPVSAIAAVSAPPREHHHAHHARREATVSAPVAATAPATAAVPVFQLSTDLHYTSASAGLRLAESFDSLADWQRMHPQAGAPAAAPAAPTAAQEAAAAEAAATQPGTPAPQPRLPAPVPAATPAQNAAPRSTEESGSWGWVAYLLGAAMALAALFMLRRRARPAPTPQFVAVSASAPVTAVSSPAPAPEPAQDDAATPIRERLRKISRGSLDQDMARRALLVDAFLDLKRYDSAERLLKELEQDLASSGEPRPGVASVSAAVRR